MRYNRPYYVPVVSKNKDYLIGFLDAFTMFSSMFDIEGSVLDSMRFNDILPNGMRRRDMEDEDIKEQLKLIEESKNIRENESTATPPDEPYLSVDCVCGNSHKFDDAVDIPEKNLVCGICGKILIDYTGIDPFEYEYDGELEKMLLSPYDDETEEESGFDDDGE